MTKVDVVAFGAHPDDVELGCGGTLAKLKQQGKKIAIIDLTQGELGTRGTKDTRKYEATKAAEILEIDYRENLKFRDGFFLNDEASKMKIIQILRKYQPEMIFANAISDRHPDHARASQLVYEASFLSGLVKINTEYNGETQKVWRPKLQFNYIQWNELTPDFVIDISDFLDIKIKSCLAYETQFYNQNSSEPLTVIATENFKESIKYRALNWGRLAGCNAAEAFTSPKLVGLKDFENFIV